MFARPSHESAKHGARGQWAKGRESRHAPILGLSFGVVDKTGFFQMHRESLCGYAASYQVG
jgi:hypothetical protein